MATTHRFGHLRSYGERYYSYGTICCWAGLEQGIRDSFVKYCDTLLRHGGERCPQEMPFCLLNEVQATADTGRLVADLFEEAAWLILMQMGNLVR
ncbi:hypothetical protein TSMEX_008927 [Taenia solium]|eukprot:TsM_000962600 transcript=TsM_000962600 gene=TsM_000962600